MLNRLFKDSLSLIKEAISCAKKHFSLSICCFIVVITGFFGFFFFSRKENSSPRLTHAISADGEPIAYTIQGKGETALVFVHGWACDSRYWRKQIPYFTQRYQVITLDLAGHGHSGMGRMIYTLRSFGEDVNAVLKDIQAENIILIGHSMGGGVAAQATALNPARIKGIIGIDNLQNVEQGMPAEQVSHMMTNFKKDFAGSATAFVSDMMVKDTDPTLKKWILQDMASAPSSVGISAFYQFIAMFNNGEMAKIFELIDVPVRCINADLWPTDSEANRRHMKSFEVKTMKGQGHFIMLENPKAFNQMLQETIKDILLD